ncbi:TerB family tellurite resistance protein [Deltaproteobacteria bacterium TL4]
MPIDVKYLDAGQTKALLSIHGISEMRLGARIFEAGTALIQKGVSTLIFDLIDVALIPMDGLGMLSTLNQQATARGGKTVLVCHNTNLRLLLNATSLSKMMMISDNLKEVLDAEPEVTGMDNFINKLNDNQRFWYLCALANMIVADGQISADEIAVAEQMFQMIELDADKAEYVQNIFQSLERHPLEPMPGIELETGKTILQTLTLIAISDNLLDPKEEEVIREVNACLMYEPSVADEVIAWGKRQVS